MWIYFNMNNICSFFFFFLKYYMKFGKNISLFMSFNCEGFSLMQSKRGSHGLPQLMTPDFYIFILELFFSLSLVFSLCFWWLCPHNYFLSFFFLRLGICFETGFRILCLKRAWHQCSNPDLKLNDPLNLLMDHSLWKTFSDVSADLTLARWAFNTCKDIMFMA